MAYSYPYFGQPYPYQDQLNQLRNNPMYPPQPRQDQGLNWVQGEAGAKSWIVAPGSTVLLMDSESMRFYLKSADPGGIPTMKVYEYQEVGSPTKATETEKFVTEDIFEGFKKEVLARLEELAAPVEVSLSRKKKGVSDE